MSSAAGDGEATLHLKSTTKRKKKAKHGDVEVAPSKPPMPAAPFRETPPHESPAPGTPTLEEAMRRTKEEGKRKTREEEQQQQAAARNPSLAMAMHKQRQMISSPPPPPPAAAQTAILEQEQEVTKKRKRRAPLPSQPSQTHSLQLEEGGVMSRKKQCKTRKHQDQMSSPSLPPAVATPIFEQDAKGKNKQKQSKEQAPLPFIPGQIHLQETQAPPEQEPEAGGRKGKCIKHNNGKKYHVPVLSNRQLIQHQLINRKEKALPAGMLPFEHFVDNCTHSPPYRAFFEQFRCDPVRQDRKPALPRTPDSLAMLPGTCRAPPQHDQAREEEVAAAVRTKERKMKVCMVMEQQLVAPSPAPNHTLEEGDVMTRKECKTRKHQDQLSSPSLPTAVGTPIFEQEAKGKKKQKQSKEQAPLPFIPGQIHLQETQAPPEQEPEAGGRKGKCIKHNNGKKYHVPVLSNRQLIQHQLINRKEKALPAGMLPFEHFVDNCTHSPPYRAFFEQFRCDPVRQDRKPALPRTPDSLAMLPPRGHPSVDSSQLTACEISSASKSKTSVASKTKQKLSGSGSGSASGSQEKLNVKIRKTTVMGTKKQRKKPPLLTSAEKRSDKYRRVPLDQLVPPPCSPHKLLQEKYASDPWKVIVICMFLNLTQGKQVRKIVDGFFERYPDPVSAFNADPKKMEAYLAPLGLQSVKTRNIQKLSKQYVENEWTYVTELCGVGKYAADAYSIFCAGKAMEVVPEDHKLVDYWNYVCFELPMMKEDLVNVEEAGVTEQNNVSLSVGESVACQNGSLG